MDIFHVVSERRTWKGHRHSGRDISLCWDSPLLNPFQILFSQISWKRSTQEEEEWGRETAMITEATVTVAHWPFPHPFQVFPAQTLARSLRRSSLKGLGKECYATLVSSLDVGYLHITCLRCKSRVPSGKLNSSTPDSSTKALLFTITSLLLLTLPPSALPAFSFYTLPDRVASQGLEDSSQAAFTK